MKKALSLLLALLMMTGLVAAFSSCKKEETPEEPIENFIVANGKDNVCTVVYAYGNDGKHRTRLRLAESVATFIFTQTGLKATVTDDREAESDGYEILIGDTNRAASVAVRAEIQDERTYIIRAADKKLVVVGGSMMMLSEAVNTFVATTKQLNYKSSKTDGTMSFRNGYNYVKTLAAVITNVEHIGYITDLADAGTHYVVQGGCTDGKYIYACLEDQKPNSGDPDYYHNTQNHTTVIYKWSIETGKTVAKSEPLSLDHANDMAYDSKTNELIVAHCGFKDGRSKILSFIDPETLTVKATRENVFEGGYGIAYNEKRDIIVTATSGYKLYKGDYLSGNGVHKNALTRVNGNKGENDFQTFVTGHTPQGIDCDDDYIYACPTGDGGDGISDANYGYLIITDWNGKHIATCRIPLPEDEYTEIETEAVFHVGNTFYVLYNTGKTQSIGHIHRFTIDGLSRTGG